MSRVSATTPEDELFILQRSGKGKWYVRKYVRKRQTPFEQVRARRIRIAAMLAEGKTGLSPLGIPWQAYYVKLLTQGRRIGKTERRKWVKSLPKDVVEKVKEVFNLD
jgi:hypothetical protein